MISISSSSSNVLPNEGANTVGILGVGGKFVFGGGAAGAALEVGRTNSDPVADDVKASAVVVIAAVSTT